MKNPFFWVIVELRQPCDCKERGNAMMRREASDPNLDDEGVYFIKPEADATMDVAPRRDAKLNK